MGEKCPAIDTLHFHQLLCASQRTRTLHIRLPHRGRNRRSLVLLLSVGIFDSGGRAQIGRVAHRSGRAYRTPSADVVASLRTAD